MCNNSLLEVRGAENVPGLKRSAEDTGSQASLRRKKDVVENSATSIGGSVTAVPRSRPLRGVQTVDAGATTGTSRPGNFSDEHTRDPSCARPRSFQDGWYQL